MSDRFDPFSDRKSRDIRNRLSDIFLNAIDAADPDLFASVIAEFLDQDPVASHQAYLNDRLRRYREAFAEIEGRKLTDRFYQSLVLWNHGLFFEAHERLEVVWKESSGEYSRALKGLIPAAGVFMYLEYGRHDSANRLASKARDIPVAPVDLLSPEIWRGLRFP